MQKDLCTTMRRRSGREQTCGCRAGSRWQGHELTASGSGEKQCPKDFLPGRVPAVWVRTGDPSRHWPKPVE